MSQSDYDAKVKDYKLAESNKETLQTSIDNAFTTLNQLMGTNANQTYNIIFDDVSYEKMPENVNVDGKINYALAVNQTVKGKKDSADVAKYALIDTIQYMILQLITRTAYILILRHQELIKMQKMLLQTL